MAQNEHSALFVISWYVSSDKNQFQYSILTYKGTISWYKNKNTLMNKPSNVKIRL
jgi:hypothetical protein